MTKTFPYRQTSLTLACALALSLLSATAGAQLNPAVQSDYVHDTRGPVVMSGYGLCWHSGTGPAPTPGVECGGTPAPVAQLVQPVPPPAYVVPAPAPVAALTPPPAPKPQKMSFSADALFAFDKSVLKPEGKVMLDDLAAQLNGTTYDVISATGHTDRFGSNEYNQKLSERRANAVKDYLVSKDILASRINAEGKGETQPITKAGECTGAKSAKVIACLQPDRRVDVEMQGTKTITSSR